MTALSNYAENEALDHALSVGAWTAPTNTYVKLHTGDPGEDCTLNAATESTRKVLTWAAAASAAITTSAGVTWASVAATETFSHISIWDDLTAGNPIAYGPLSASVPVDASDEFRIDSGDIDITMDEAMFTLAAANSLLDHMTGRAAWTMPAGSFVKLHLGDPGNAAASNPAAETTRVSATFGASSGGATDNTNIVTWTAVTATEAVTHYSIWSAVTAGDPIISAALSATANLTATEDARFSVGALDLAMT